MNLKRSEWQLDVVSILIAIQFSTILYLFTAPKPIIKDSSIRGTRNILDILDRYEPVRNSSNIHLAT
jgi:hypothetical protein